MDDLGSDIPNADLAFVLLMEHEDQMHCHGAGANRNAPVGIPQPVENFSPTEARGCTSSLLWVGFCLLLELTFGLIFPWWGKRRLGR